MGKDRIVGKIKRRKGYGYYVDAEGNVREFKLRKRGRKGRRRKTCSG